MPLVQKTIGNTAYYTDGVKYYTFHQITKKNDPFYIFACRDLGINKTSGFTPDEQKRINDLAGMVPYQKNKVSSPEERTGSANALSHQHP
jgi:hypothetical protein